MSSVSFAPNAKEEVLIYQWCHSKIPSLLILMNGINMNNWQINLSYDILIQWNAMNYFRIIISFHVFSGTHCDKVIYSGKGKNGTVQSPMFPGPYSPRTFCRYEFQGQGKERIQVSQLFKLLALWNGECFIFDWWFFSWL